MPGSIQVSVLGLMDHASPPPLSSLSLRVSMGKREYGTVGGGELSIPVVSLRENLIVMVHDAEGEEILRTEFRTMLLLELGLWDNLFPLKNGGSLQMKLQFLLSEDDRKRIREMRDAALKRRSFSDNRIGYSPTRRIADGVSEGMLLDNSVLAEPIVEPSSADQREKLPADITGEKFSSNLNSPQTISKSFSIGILSDISSEGKSKLLKEPFVLKKTHNPIPAMHYETPRNKDFKSDAKIKKSASMEIKDAGPLHSAKFGSYVLVDNVSNTIGSEKYTSERKEFASVDVRKGSSILPIIQNFETSRAEGDLNLIRKEGGGLVSNVTSKESFSSHGSTDITCKKRNDNTMIIDGMETSYEGVERKINTADNDGNENNNGEHNLRNESLPSTKMLENLGKIEHSGQKGMLEEVVRTKRDENMLERPLNEQSARAEHSTAGKKHDRGISSEEFDGKIKIIDNDDNENEDSLPNEQGTSVEVAETLKNDEIALQSPSNEIVEALNSCFDWVCPVGILGIWTPRHLCVTTGSKLLREFAEIYGSSSMEEDDTKKDGDAYLHDNECKLLSSQQKDGGLIEQGVWICFIIAACGLLLKGL